MINTSERIKNIVATIEYERLVDVGTDHGFIAILSVQSGKTKNVIACDLNEKPLLSCQNNIKKYGLSESIKTVLSNGLLNVECDYESVSICGMGGLLVCNILSAEVEKTKKFSQLILQPQSDYYEVRKQVYELGFYIKNEIYFIDNLKNGSHDKYYMVFNCHKKNVDMPTEKELMFGVDIDKDSLDTYKKYIQMTYDKAKKAFERLIENSKTDITEKKEYYEKVLKYCEEILNEAGTNL